MEDIKHAHTQSTGHTGRVSSHKPPGRQVVQAAEMRITLSSRGLLWNTVGGATWENHFILIFWSLKEKGVFTYHWDL